MKVIVQNLSTEYQDEGDGRVMLFLHGWKDDLHTFDALASLLPHERRIIRLDLPGFGESEAPKETWNLDDYVKFVKGFTQKIDVEVETLVGHSFGGRIAIKSEAAKTLRAKKIVLIGSAGAAKSRMFRNSLLKFLAKLWGLIMYIPPLIFWRERVRKSAYAFIGSDYMSAGALKETFLKIISDDVRASAKKIITPTLLIWGESDTETPLSDGKRLFQLIIGSRLEVISGAGHFVHKEKPEQVAKLVQEFIEPISK